MPTYKFINLKTPTDTSVSFKTLDKDLGIVESFDDSACFSGVTYQPISNRVKYVYVTRSMKWITYEKHIINKWIEELNDLGFPCAVEYDKNKQIATFKLNIEHFKKKIHFSSTLSLIRCLWETGICFVPEAYFSKYKKGMTLDERWMLLQDSHKDAQEMSRDNGIYINTNHMVTNARNDNIDRIKFWDRIENCSIDVYSSNGYYGGKSESIEKTWNGAAHSAIKQA